MVQMSQLPLKMIPTLGYSPQHYVLHAGVSEIVSVVTQIAASGRFTVVWLRGTPRSGKTHLGVYLAGIAADRGRYPRCFEGIELADRISALSAEGNLRSDDFVLVDDCDRYLENISPGMSGEFVAFVERARLLKVPLIFTATRSWSELDCDEHIKSRLAAGMTFEIGAPDEAAHEPLVRSMLKQRGLQFDARKIQFLIKRLGRSPSEIELYLSNLELLAETLGRGIDFPLLTDALPGDEPSAK